MQLTPSTNKFKDDFESYVNKATILIHSPQTRNQMLASLKGPDPVQLLSDAAVLIMQRIDNSAREHGVEVQDAVKALASHKIVDLLVELADMAKLFTLPKEVLGLAYSVTVQDYVKAEQKAGRISAKQLGVLFQADLRNMPPKMRKEAQTFMKNLPLVARKYNHGKGIDTSWKPKQEKTVKQEVKGA